MPRMKKPALSKAQVIKAAQKMKLDPAVLASAGKSEVTGFLNFVRQQGIVGLAVGLAVGTAAGATVKQIVDGFINPIVGLLIGGVDLSKLQWVAIRPAANGTGGLVFSWGAILSSLITLLATAFVIYWLVHVAKLDRLDRKKE